MMVLLGLLEGWVCSFPLMRPFPPSEVWLLGERSYHPTEEGEEHQSGLEIIKGIRGPSKCCCLLRAYKGQG